MNRKIVVEMSNNEEYPYNAQVWSFINGKWWYGGYGKYCHTIEEVLKYADERNLSVEFC